MSIRDRIRPIKHLQHHYFICVLENPADVVNIGSAIRNISAFGVEKLYIIGEKSLVKSFDQSKKDKRLKNLSVGANKWVFVKHFNSTSECIKHLKKNLYTIAVTSSHIKGKENLNLFEGNFTQNRLAIFFGNEARGVSEEAVENADFCIQIPMGGVVESLNLGTSTGIVLSFIGYQRWRFIYEKKIQKFKPQGEVAVRGKSWSDFLNPWR